MNNTTEMYKVEENNSLIYNCVKMVLKKKNVATGHNQQDESTKCVQIHSTQSPPG